MHTPPIKAASWVVLYDRGPVRAPDLPETRQDHVISADLDRGCDHDRDPLAANPGPNFQTTKNEALRIQAGRRSQLFGRDPDRRRRARRAARAALLPALSQLSPR